MRLTSANRRADGDQFEQIALDFLIRQGLTLVTRNWRSKNGEIDLILREKTDLIFVEVRKRNDSSFGGALASIDQAKTARIVAAANDYLARLPSRPNFRIDAVVFDAGARPQWAKNILA